LLFLYRRAQRGASGTTDVLVSACAKKNSQDCIT